MSKQHAFRRMVAWLALLGAMVAGTAWAQPSAEQEEQGKQLAREAFDAYKQGDFQTAFEKFDGAREVYPTGQVLRMTGYALLALERWLEAAGALEAALQTTYKPLEEGVRQEVQDNLDKALGHLSTAVISSEVEGATVTIDGGEPQSLPAEVRLLEGTHTFVASAEGHTDDERTVNLPAGQRYELDLRPVQLEATEPAPEPPPPVRPAPPPDEPTEGWFPYQKEIGFAVGGAGVAMLGVGIATLVAGTSLRSATQENIDAHDAAWGPNCSSGDYTLCYYDVQLINEDGKRADTLQTAGVTLTVLGTVLTATGVTFLVFAPWGDAQEAGSEPASSPSGGADQTASRRRPRSGTVACGPHGLPGLGCAGTF